MLLPLLVLLAAAAGRSQLRGNLEQAGLASACMPAAGSDARPLARPQQDLNRPAGLERREMMLATDDGGASVGHGK